MGGGGPVAPKTKGAAITPIPVFLVLSGKRACLLMAQSGRNMLPV